MSSVRRAWLYGLMVIALGILAAGVRNLLALALDIAIKGAPNVGAGLVQREFSLGLAMTIIGTPLWFLFWRTVQRNVHGLAVEVGSAIRKFFLNLVLVVSGIIVLNSGADFLRWLLSGVPVNQFSSGGLALLIVFAAIWYYHWSVNENEGQPSPAARTLRRWYIYILAGWGLVWLTVGVASFVNSVVVSLPIWGETLVRGESWSPAAQRAVAWFLCGGLAWAFHWFRMSTGDFDSTLRQVYLYLVAILGSAIAGLVAIILTADRILLWAFGGAASGAYFQFLAWTIPTTIVAAAVWVYHQQVAREEAAQVHDRRLSARRVHFYLMSFVGLGAMISGLIILLGILIDLPINSMAAQTVKAPGWWRTQLAVAIALLVVSVPMWLHYWSRIVDVAAAGGIVEWRARSRRTYLYVIIGVAIIALAADLVNIVYQILNGILTAFGVDILRNSKWSLQSLVVAIPVLTYHWKIARQDQQRGAEAAAIHKSVTILASDGEAGLVSQLEDKLGFKVRVLRCLAAEGAITGADLDSLVAEIQAVPSAKVMVVPCAGKPLVLPYEEK